MVNAHVGLPVLIVAVIAEMWCKIRDATGEQHEKRERERRGRSSYLPQSSDQSSTMEQVASEEAREREKEKKRDQANLRRADDLLSHTEIERRCCCCCCCSRSEKKSKSMIRFEADQVSDLTRRRQITNRAVLFAQQASRSTADKNWYLREWENSR